MSANLPSDEVADDYRNSLEDLITNDRYQISTLTLIAKENIEHAEGISRVLQNHIQRAPPARKLPALYVLDSIVKNVGTPYTVYFGRNLHQIFMYAYSQVDPMVRRKLEEMLKTWREPVPGSLATTPVFPITSTQQIVDSLNRYRSSSVPQPPRSGQLPQHRLATPNSPPSTVGYPAPLQAFQQYAPPIYAAPSQPSQSPFPYNHQRDLHPPVDYGPVQPSPILPRNNQPALTDLGHIFKPAAVDMVKLHDDIDDLTTDAKIDCATHPMDAEARRKLASLQGLKELLDSSSLSEKDLLDIRDSILQQRAKKLALHQPTPPPVIAQHQSFPLPTPFAQTHTPVHTSVPADTPSFLNQVNLSELLKATASRTQTPIGHSVPRPPQVDVSAPSTGFGVLNSSAELPLLAQLRASGLLSNAPTPMQNTAPTIPLVSASHIPRTNQTEVQFTSVSMKMPRPQMIISFLNQRPNQCSTCGRRFASDDAGRERKAKHLDWHFKTRTTMAAAEERGQNRSWYVDECEWIVTRESEDDENPLNVSAGPGSGLPTSKTVIGMTQQYVRAPTDPALRNAPCPIDQENFRSEWSEELQDFIWKDAVLVGGRYYHASCYRDLMQGREMDVGGLTPLGAGTGRTSTPDSLLGKRKADVGYTFTKIKRTRLTESQQADVNGVNSKMKLELL